MPKLMHFSPLYVEKKQNSNRQRSFKLFNNTKVCLSYQDEGSCE